MKVHFISLGCDKNLVDSENMLAMLCEDGIEITGEAGEADVIVVNTCCFIGDAKEESIQTILEMAEYKKTGCAGLVVTGCLAERYRAEIQKEIPEADAILGTNSYDAIVKAVRKAAAKERYEKLAPLEGLPVLPKKRILTGGGHSASLKIAEGCGKRCTYCIIPSIRGNYRSVPIEEIVAQARELAAYGTKELILVAQETTLYGIDLYGKKSLDRLLDALNQIPGIAWIRLLYCYPEEIDDALIDAILRNEKVCHYLDMPIQHASDEILKRMGRKTSRSALADTIAHLRERIPDLCIRTTVICGFPGETEQMHEELMQFINDMEFDRLGAFAYSPEEGTPAYQFPNHLTQETKLCRVEDVMQLQQEISFEKNEELIGTELVAFIEGNVEGENVYAGRTYRDAPDVDGYIFIHADRQFLSGDLVKVKITGAYEYDLIGDAAE